MELPPTKGPHLPTVQEAHELLLNQPQTSSAEKLAQVQRLSAARMQHEPEPRPAS